MNGHRSNEIQVPSLLSQLRLVKGRVPISCTEETERTCYLLASDSFLSARPAPATVWLTASTDMSTQPAVSLVYKSSTLNCTVNCGLPSTFVMESLALDVRTSAFYCTS